MKTRSIYGALTPIKFREAGKGISVTCEPFGYSMRLHNTPLIELSVRLDISKEPIYLTEKLVSRMSMMFDAARPKKRKHKRNT